MPPSLAALRERLVRRGQDPERVVDERLKVAPAEIAHLPEYDYVVVNDDFGAALTRVKAILTAERCRTLRRVREKGQGAA
jgi:guanylate kinase